MSFHYTGLRKNVLVLSERSSTGVAAQISFRQRTSWQRRAEFDAIETLRRIRRGICPVERQRGRIGDEDVAPLREIGRSLNRVIRPALAADVEAELPASE